MKKSITLLRLYEELLVEEEESSLVEMQASGSGGQKQAPLRVESSLDSEEDANTEIMIPNHDASSAATPTIYETGQHIKIPPALQPNMLSIELNDWEASRLEDLVMRVKLYNKDWSHNEILARILMLGVQSADYSIDYLLPISTAVHAKKPNA